MPSRKQQEEALQRATDFFNDSRDHHDELVSKIERRYDSYRAVLEIQSAAASSGSDWQSRLYPPYVMHIVDSTLASMVEDRLRYTIKPRVTMESMFDPAAPARAKAGAEAHQILFDWQVRQTKFTRIQRPFLLQNAIAGITVAKTSWAERNERRRRMTLVDEPLLDDYGDQIFHPQHGAMTYPKLVEETAVINVYDGPMTEVVDIYDFGWPKNARTLSNARYVWHRIWISREELEQGFRDGGPYGPDQGGWSLRKVQSTIGETRSSGADSARRNEREANHAHDLMAVIEVWDQHLKEVITFVDGNYALLAYKTEFPFFHEQTPFTVCTTQPDLFSVVGISQVEKVQALQEMLWAISNQRIDNLRLINNAIAIFRPDLEDASALEYAPGALWPLEDPEQVQMWTPNPMPADISIGAEALIKGDMQNLASTFPFSTGAESQTVDQKTATGASIVSALAQRSIDMAKQPVYDAWEDIGNQRMILNGQFIREPVAASVLGLNGEDEVRIIFPELLVGDYDYVQEPIPDALAKQEEQATAQALVQLMGDVAPLLLPLSQAGAARMVNFDAVIEFYLKAIGIEDTEQFFLSQAPAAALPQPGSGPAEPGGEQTLGITGEGSIDPSVSPGAQISSSPITNVQRALALGRGGGRNA